MRNKYFVPFGRLQDFNHPAPERTAFKSGQCWDSEFICQIWPSREAMLQACKMSNTGELGKRFFRPLVK